MKYCLLLFAAINFTVAFSQNDTIWYDKKWNKSTKEDAAFYRPRPKVENGKYYIIDYYANGKKQMEGWALSEAAEKWDGEVKYYHENGKPHSLYTYKNGTLHGPALAFYTDGIISGKSSFINGKLEGKVYRYTRTGAVELEIEYVNGKRNGKLKQYYEMDGALKETASYVNDSLEGEVIRYYPSGKVAMKVNMVNNKVVGDMVQYFEDGNIEGKMSYVNGKKEGPLVMYYESGKLKKSETYKNDLQEGLSTSYYPYGVKEVEGKYKKGQKIGQWKYNRLEGDKMITFVVPDSTFTTKIAAERKRIINAVGPLGDTADGYYTKKYDNGKRRLVGTYTNGKKVSHWRYYLPSGRLWLEETYNKDGILIEDQVFYSDSGVRSRVLYYNEAGKLHGMTSEYDEKGDEKEGAERYFVNGVEQYDIEQYRKNRRIYEGDTVGNDEDIIQEEVMVAEYEEPLKLKIDTTKMNRGIKLSTTLAVSVLKGHASFEEVELNIYMTDDTAFIAQQYISYKPKANEVAFWYAENNASFAQPVLKFRLGDDIKEAFKKRDIWQGKIALLLRDDIFKTDDFPTPFADEQLRKEF